MRVYHFTSVQHAISNIRMRHLKVATLPDINDPFEFAVCCDDKVRRTALRATRREWATTFGMLCFSRNWHNPVQWSHYADKHRGICLGFDVPDEFLVTVQYSEEPPTLDWDAIEAGGERGELEMMRWSSTKFRHWQYENEVRVFLPRENNSELQFESFGDGLKLREVIVGPESTATRLEIAEAIGSMNGVKSFRARLAFQKYRVVHQQDGSLWI
jgi:hypothetical protein